MMNPQRYHFASSLAHAVVWIEHLARIAWAPASIALLCLALANFDLLPLLPPWLHAAVLLAGAIAIASSLRQGLITHGRPRSDAGRRRIERDSGLSGRPYDALHDTPIDNSEVGFVLWKAHQDRARGALARFRLRPPRSDLAAHDTRAWRALTLLLFCVSLVTAGTSGFSSRLDAALSPRIMGGIAARDISVDAWLTPPAYTALPPVVLPKAGAAEAPEVPQGTVLQVRVGGGTARPHIEVNGKRRKFQAVDRHDFTVTETLDDDADIRITQGWRTLARWHVEVPETPAPVIAWNAPPKGAERGETKLDYTAADPYGLARIRARMELSPDEAIKLLPAGTALDQPGARVHEVDLPDVADHPKSVKAGSVQDWADSPWAGLKVQLTLTATGASGLTGATKSVDFVLPERAFTNPAARAIVEQRKRLIRDPLATRIDVATAIVTLGSHPELYGDDPAAFLALRVAAMRIYRDATLADLPDAEAILWQTAIRMEDGGKSDAQKELAKAAEALRQALARNAPSAEIADLTAALKKAMQRYLAEMQREMERKLANGEKIPEIPPELSGAMMDRQKFADMIDKMQSMAESGSRDAASDLLNQFESMMQNLRMAQSRGDSKTSQAWQALKAMRGLAERQQALNDRNYQRSQGQQPQQTPQGDAKEQQDVQSALKGLQDQLKSLGQTPPESLDQAQQDMGSAGKGMEQQNFNSATGSGRSALDELRQGMQTLSEQIGKQLGQNGAPGQGTDPFGRGGNGGKSGDDDKVKIPDQSAQQRSREVLDELRKRDGDRTLPKPEHEYIDRLLREF
jgi:uncharacterized protein (TIGR02302 family)